ncbi:MAG: efflux RND transporter periplasmic adaptor subunit [Alphaproteobacteria bacterium]
MKKKLFLIGSIIFVSVLLVFSYQKTLTREKSEALTLFGNVDIRDVALGFRVSGKIDAINVEEGDLVSEGSLLAVLDQEPFEDELSLRNAEVAEAEASYNNAIKLYERRSKLVKTGAVSQGDYDDALALRDETKARLDTVKASLKQTKTKYQDSKLLSPSSGIILTRAKEKGAIVSAGDTVLVLALDNPVWIRTYIEEPYLGKIYSGMKAVIKTDSGNNYQGQIGFISPQAEFTPKNVETTQLRTNLVYRLRIIVDAPDKGLRQGMPVTIYLEND